MEVNKDEAERCIEIATEALKSGNIVRAEKFLNKAENLYPSQRAKGKWSVNRVNVVDRRAHMTTYINQC